MKTSLLLAVALIAPAALPAASFEGRVNFKMTTQRGPQELAYSIKGDKLRVDMPGQAGFGGVIIDIPKRESTIIMDQQKMYMTMALPEATAQKASKQNGEATLDKTGEKETILGYLAEKFVSTSQGTKTEMWLAEGLGTFMMANGNPMGGRRGGGGDAAPQGWEKALAGKELFPLRVVSKDSGGKETFRMEATAIDKKPQADSLFVPPAGYQKFDMGNMMKGMIPGFGK